MLLLGAVALLALPADLVPSQDSAVAPSNEDPEILDSWQWDGPKFNVKEIATQQLNMLRSKLGKSKVLNNLEQKGALVGNSDTVPATRGFASGKITCICKCKIPKSSRDGCMELIKKFTDATWHEFPAASKYTWFLEKTKNGVPYSMTIIEEYASEEACLEHLIHVGDCSQEFVEKFPFKSVHFYCDADIPNAVGAYKSFPPLADKVFVHTAQKLGFEGEFMALGSGPVPGGDNGEERCEGHGYDKDACEKVGCCQFAECPDGSGRGECHSNVGPGACKPTPFSSHQENGDWCAAIK
jgi:quinol monooxygenase YgiN